MSRDGWPTIVAILLGSGLFGPPSVGAAPPGPADLNVQIKQAEALRAAQKYAAAGDLLLRGARGSPGSPRAAEAAARAGSCFEAAGKWSEALQAYELATSGGASWWVNVALYRKAAVCAGQGCPDRAAEAIRQLQTQSPETTQAVQASMLDDQMNRRDPAANQQLYAREVQAAGFYDAALAAQKVDPAGGLQLLEAVAREYPETPAALRALESRAHLLARANRRDDSAAAFEAIIRQVGVAAPTSRIVLTAKTRLAKLYGALGRKSEALQLCEEVVQAGDSPLAPTAGLLAAATHFEFLQHGELSPSPAHWEQVRQRCQVARASRFANPAERARAETIAIETLCWEGRSAEAVEAARRFLQRPEARAATQDVATVLFFAGEELQKLGRYDEALAYYRRVMQLYQGRPEIWPGMDHLPRTCYRIWETLRRTQAPPAEIEAAAQTLLSGFPDSEYARQVKFVIEMEER